MKTTILSIVLIIALSKPIQANATKVPVGEKIDETTYFEFHSNYLMNLHHFLVKKGLQLSKTESDPIKQFDILFKDDVKTVLRPEVKAKVMQAIQFYADSISKSNLLFDPRLTELKYALEATTVLKDLKAKEPIKGTVDALEKASRFYAEFFWQEQDKKNRAYLGTILKQVKQIEKAVIDSSSKYYGYKHNGKKFRVDLVDYATFYGAYTTTEPYINAVISSTDKKHDGTQGVEIVFHEVSHGMIDNVFLAQEKLSKEMGKEFDHNVWHTILFYSAGTFVKNELAKQNTAHELYIYKNKLGSIAPSFQKTLDAVAIYWQSYLDGKTDMETAVKDILKAL
ncbi:MAG: hypothetical protein K0S33_2336 [Bacteroidetes bacterium]|jgi:hypothetical protein|nr:hypothetical protein [Bacteroidota bacterium]